MAVRDGRHRSWLRGIIALHREHGAVAAEYALLLSLIALAILLAAGFLGAAISDLFTDACSEFPGC